MWVRTHRNNLSNVDRFQTIGIVPEGDLWNIKGLWDTQNNSHKSQQLAAYGTKELAEAALDMLQEWIDKNGVSGGEGYYSLHKVFDFRKLEIPTEDVKPGAKQ